MRIKRDNRYKNSDKHITMQMAITDIVRRQLWDRLFKANGSQGEQTKTL